MILTNTQAQRVYLASQQLQPIGGTVDITIGSSPWQKVRIAEANAGGTVTITKQGIGLPTKENYISMAAMAAAYGIDTTGSNWRCQK